MSSQPTKPKPSDIAQRMRKVALHDKPATAADAAAREAPPPLVEPVAPPPRERRIRYTLDLSPEQHRSLKRFAFDAEVDASAIVRVLLAELGRDHQLAERVLSQARTPRDNE